MKILHYIPTYAPAWDFGGPVRSVSTLCEGLVRRGHEVTVFTTDAGLSVREIPARGQVVLRNGVRVIYFSRETGRGIKSTELEKAVQAHAGEFDLVHVTAIWQRTGPAACRAAKLARVPYCISPRGALGAYSWTRGRWKKSVYYWLRERRSLRDAAGFHYTSAMEADECAPFRFGRPYCIVPNAIDLGFWRQNERDGRRWREEHAILPGEIVLLFAGRLHHKKGLELLPDVVGSCRRDGVPVRLVLIGPEEDETADQLRSRIASLGIAAHVSLLPATTPENLRTAYSGAQIFVFPSRHENFGNAAVEAAACGCRVIVSEHTGVAQELAALGVGECLPLQSDLWVRAVRRHLDAKSPASQSTQLRARFGVEETVARMEQFYAETLKGWHGGERN